MTGRYLDVRRQSPAALEATLLADQSPLVVAASQMAALGRRVRDREMIAVVPDFLEYARLVSSGQARALLDRAGGLRRVWRAALAAGFGVIDRPLRLASADFWLGAEAFLRFDLALLHDFHGAVVLHPYLTDFSVCLGRDSFLERFAALAARWQYFGFWTYQFPLAVSALSRRALAPSVVVLASAVNDEHSQRTLRLARETELLRNTNYLIDLEPLAVGAVDPTPSLLERHPGLAGVVIPESPSVAETRP
jgi:hypothetical protein